MTAHPYPFEPDPERIRGLADDLEADGHANLAALARRVADELEAERAGEQAPDTERPPGEPSG